MSIRKYAMTWMREYHPNELGNELRASKYHLKDIWFFTCPTSYFDKNNTGHINFLLQFEIEPELFHYLKVPFEFLRNNQTNFAVRSCGDKFDLHISAKQHKWLIDERKGVGFHEFEQKLDSHTTLDSYTTVECQTSNKEWRHVKLVRGITFEYFLPTICYMHCLDGDAHKPSQFILDWASSDMESAASFMAGFLAKLFREIDVMSFYLIPKVYTSFGENCRPSVSNSSFREFCERLSVNQELIKLIRNNPVYPKCSPEDREFFQDKIRKPKEKS